MDIRHEITSAIHFADEERIVKVDSDTLTDLVISQGPIRIEHELQDMMYGDMADVAHAAAKALGFDSIEKHAACIIRHSGAYARYRENL